MVSWIQHFHCVHFSSILRLVSGIFFGWLDRAIMSPGKLRFSRSDFQLSLYPLWVKNLGAQNNHCHFTYGCHTKRRNIMACRYLHLYAFDIVLSIDLYLCMVWFMLEGVRIFWWVDAGVGKQSGARESLLCWKARNTYTYKTHTIDGHGCDIHSHSPIMQQMRGS